MDSHTHLSHRPSALAVLQRVTCAMALLLIALQSAKAENFYEQQLKLFQPFDAPFVANDYKRSIENLIYSYDRGGSITLLGPGIRNLYLNELGEAPLVEMTLNDTGVGFFSANKTKLYTQKGDLTPGFSRFRTLLGDFSDQDPDAGQGTYYRSLVDLFAQGDAIAYYCALQAVRKLSPNPVTTEFRRDVTSMKRSLEQNPIHLIPSPDDLDIQSDWQTVAISNLSKDAFVYGLVSIVDILYDFEARQLEHFVDKKKSNSSDIFLPSRLLFAKALRSSTEMTSEDSFDHLVTLSAERFEIFYSNFVDADSGVFLLAIENRRLFQ